MSNPENRMFYLMLSALEGQQYADLMGYQPPSEEVQKFELIDVMSRWVLFEKIGLLQEIKEASSAFVDLLQKIGRINSPPSEFATILEAFSVSMLNTALDKNIIGITIPQEIFDEFNFDEDDLETDASYNEFYDLINDKSLFEDIEDEDE